MTLSHKQISTYLSEHETDPVNWYPWGDEAIALARKKNRPILLSIGYSASHQCKVMSRESFTSNQIAKLMNNQYVNILVDREERRDIDRLYQAAHRLLTRSGGGWPLTVFIDPNDLLPFYSGTYFPAQANEKAPAFRDVLKRMADTYESQFEKIQEFKDKLKDAIIKSIGGGEPAEIDTALVDPACAQIDASFDEKYGGFEKAPKFPHAPGLAFLLEAIPDIENSAQADRAKHMLDFTLANLSSSGMYDPVGGGFFGYSVERDWSIPHFEKTLGDNAQLLSVLAQRSRENDIPWFEYIANHSADWMLREMRLACGAFASTLDAESNNTEGRYYTWSKDEVKAVLAEDASEFSFAFGLDKSANFRGKWHLRRPAPENLHDLPDQQQIERFKVLLPRLAAARASRHAPARDDSVVVAWNAMAIKALSDIAQVFDRPDCAEAAHAAIDYLRDTHWQNSSLVGLSKNGKCITYAFVDDYAFLLHALTTLDEAHLRPQDLAFAREVADKMIENFYDKDAGGFYFSPHQQANPIHPLKIFADDWYPAGNAIACIGLTDLASLANEPAYFEIAAATLKAGMSETTEWPSAHATMIRALTHYKQYTNR